MKKKSLCFILIAVMLLCLLTTGFAANSPQYRIQDQTVSAGEEFVLDVSISDNPGIVTLRCKVEYDSATLELLSVENKGLLQGYTNPAPTVNSPYTLRWADSLAAENNTANGVICTLRFRALTAGNSSIKISHAEARNASGQKVSFADSVSTVTVYAAPSCDLNGDGTVDIVDMACLYGYLCGETTPTDAVKAAADCNGDGVVNILDYQALYERVRAG